MPYISLFMFKKAIHFIQYNNLTVFIILGFFLVGSSVFAQTETGQEIIGTKQVIHEGIDNTLLIEADLDNLQMDYNIENIEQDEKYYYVTYTFINLEEIDQAWQYQVREKKRKVSRKLRMDLGKYLAEELKEEYQARVKELKAEKKIAEAEGQTQITEVVEYSGLIGRTLELASSVFTGYEPVKTKKLPSPSVPILLTMARDSVDDSYVYQSIDNDLKDVYADYVAKNDPDEDGVFGVMDNCPDDYNPDQMDIDEDGMGNVCDPHPEDYDKPKDTEDDNIEIEETASSTEETASSSPETIGDNNASSSDEEIIDDTEAGETGEEVVIDEGEEEADVEIIELPNNNTETGENNLEGTTTEEVAPEEPIVEEDSSTESASETGVDDTEQMGE